MFGVGLMMGLMLAFAIAMAKKTLDLGKSWVITVPETIGAKAKIERRRVKRGKVTDKMGDEAETKILSGDCSYPTNRGPLQLVSEYGANLVAPTKDEARDAKTGKPIKDDETGFKRFRIWDPQTYWRATRENDMEDLYSAQREKDHWAIKLAPVAIIMFIGLMAFMGFMLWKIMPLLNKAGG